MISSETKTCQNCKNSFQIESEDFDFYKKIDVPPPTRCPECRMIRRWMFRNGRYLYKHKCDAPGHTEKLISKYSEDAPVNVYDYEYWKSDAWDPFKYGIDYDKKKPFFEQFRKLFNEVPVKNLDIINSENCSFCPSVTNSKNCYMTIGGFMAENCLFANTCGMCKDCVDTLTTVGCDTLYECSSCFRSVNIMFCYHSADCIDSKFLFDCRGCSQCFGCAGLRNKNYCIFNKQYSRQEYLERMSKINLGSYKELSDAIANFERFLLVFPRKFAFMKNAINCTGNVIENAKNCQCCFEVINNVENCKYSFIIGEGMKDSYDVFAGGKGAELIYESGNVNVSQKVFFSDKIQGSTDVNYSVDCYSCSNLFGCVALKNKEYCILNKQYNKDTFNKLKSEIIKDMNEKPYIDMSGIVYRYGEFFPTDIFHFGYNETAAQEFNPLTRGSALKAGYKWKNDERMSHKIDIYVSDIPDNIYDVQNDILNKNIECFHGKRCVHNCTGAFRLIPEELRFYKVHNLALPRLCPNCRYFERLKFRTGWKLYKRVCQCGGTSSSNDIYKNTSSHTHGSKPCSNEFETSYAPERPEIVYCEACYQNEVS